jgi:selenocysteine-specific elongation factor
MRAPAFDAVLEFPLDRKGRAAAELRAVAVFPEGRTPVRIHDYAFPGRREAPFVRVLADAPVEARWGDPFEVRAESGEVLGRGACLYPGAPAPDELKPARRKALLARLALGEKDMVLALTEAGGLEGLHGERLVSFARLPASRAESLARALEAEGRLRILGFAPLRLISEVSLDFLRERVVAFVARYHKTHPSQRGAPLDKLEKRFGAPKTVLTLALRLLAKEGRAVEESGLVRLPDFRIPLTPAEEETLDRLEAMVLSGELGSVTLDDLRARLKLTQGKLQTLLAALAERRKIVEGVEGFILHSRWLDEIVRKVRGSGKKELTVAEFKAMTGLSRKYAIPLLELLDSLSVTRRKGSVRDIL